ncbi:hypothetical protein ACMYZ5_11635 [Bacteroides sp. KG68]|uniref:hypothetical protein n=1 Tax=unclassified Bacteroides TaxID=2646097 RepID=UPI003D7FB8F8
MKNVLLLLLALILSACTSTKKNLDVSKVKVDSLGYQVTREVKFERFADTTLTTTGRLVITEIEFFAPDSALGIIERLLINGDNVDVSGIRGNPIRSIKQKAFESTTEKKGEDKESREDKEKRQSASLQKENMKQTKQVTPNPDPYRWLYAFYISLLLVAVLLYLKRVPILNWIKKILAGILKIL